MFKRIFQYLSLAFGAVGFVACVAATVATWTVSAQVNQASENVFGAVDHSIVAVQQRVRRTQDRVEALKITAERIEERIKAWGEVKARERAISRRGIEEDIERLASGLEQADYLMDLTESSLQLAQTALEAMGSLGFSVQTEPDLGWRTEIVSLRAQLTRMIEPIERIRELASEEGEEDPSASSLGQSAKLAVSVIATLTSIDSRLEKLVERLADLRTNTQSAEVAVKGWIRMMSLGFTLLVSWMAAGQVALCCLGWNGCCGGRQDRRPAGTPTGTPLTNADTASGAP